MKKYVIVILISLFIFLGFFMYIGKIESDIISFDFSKEREKEISFSNKVKIPIEKVRSLNPIISKDYHTYQISKLVYESLFFFDDNYLLKKGLVDTFVNDDKKGEIILNLRKNVYFSSGKQLTGDDVKSSIDAYIYQGERNNTAYVENVKNIKSVAVDKNNPFQVIIKLKDKNINILDSLTFPIVSAKEILGKNNKIMKNLSKVETIGSGAYKVESYSDVSNLILVGNRFYNSDVRYRDMVGFIEKTPTNVLEFMILPDEDSAVPLLEVNFLNLGMMRNLNRDIYLSDSPLKSIEFISNKAEIIGFNCEKGIASLRQFRKALVDLIDVEDINKNVYLKKLNYTGSIYSNQQIRKANKKGEAERKLAENLLYKIQSENNDIRNKAINILVNGENAYSLKVVSKLVSLMKQYNFEIDVKMADNSKDFINRIKSKKFDIFVGTVTMNENFDMTEMLSSKVENLANYKNEKIDYYLENYKKAVTLKSKKEAIKNIDEIVKKDVPYYNLGYRTYSYFMNQSLTGDEGIYQFNNIYKGCENWKCKEVK